jgi:hypothetical protein
MPASAFWRFTDPDEYTARVRATRMELAITRPGRFAAKLIFSIWLRAYWPDQAILDGAWKPPTVARLQ